MSLPISRVVKCAKLKKMRFRNFCRAVYISTIIVIILCDENDDVGRSKRFFQHLNSYFSSKTTTDAATLLSSTEKPSRIVKILVSTTRPAVSPCIADDCTSSKIYNPVYEGSTPITYLTPPPPADAATLYDISKYYETYQSPTPYRDDTAKRNYGYQYFNAYNNNDLWMVGKDHKTIYDTFSQPTGELDSLKVKLKDVSCVKSTKNGKFSVAMITSKSLQVAPVIEYRYTNDNNHYLPTTTSKCAVTTQNSTTYSISILEPDMIRCGVYYCDSNVDTNLMCLTLRFPVIFGIRTSNDVIMRIECRSQPQLVSHVKQLRLKSNSNDARTLPIHATITGGNPVQEMRSQVSIYAMTDVGFTQLLGYNDVVSIGQQLQLKCIVKNGDGWNFSRLGPVMIQKELSSSNGYFYGENLDSIVIVSDDGCVNPQMKPICPVGPFADPTNPLITLLNLQMFVFENMKDGDELSLSITIYGCVNYEDCFPKGKVCQEWQLSPTRYKRSITVRANITDSTSKIKLRIRNVAKTETVFKCNKYNCDKMKLKIRGNFSVLLSTICIISLALIAYLTGIYCFSKIKYHY